MIHSQECIQSCPDTEYMSHRHPKKSLGQHFLKDENIARKIAGSLKALCVEQVIEIGSGTGILTRYLFEREDIQVTAVEIDAENVAELKRKFSNRSEQIIHKDALQLSFSDLSPHNLAVIGNFPYNISSSLFFKILEHRDQVEEVVCMIQHEVAERIAAPPGTKTYGILSVLLQAWYEIEYLFPVSPDVFHPPPRVTSAVIRLTRNDVTELGCNEKQFQRVVKACFNQRRKMIRNSIRNVCPDIKSDHYLMQQRPEQLSVAEFVELTGLVEQLCT